MTVLNVFKVNTKKKESYDWRRSGVLLVYFEQYQFNNVMFCTIWYHLYNLKNEKNTHGGVLL